jgi:hypothetical protein
MLLVEHLGAATITRMPIGERTAVVKSRMSRARPTPL